MMGPDGAIRPPCADNPQLFDMTSAPLKQVIEATRACRDCPLQALCATQPRGADDQMQAGVIYHVGRSGRRRSYTTTEWIKFKKLMPSMASPEPQPKRIHKRAARKDNRERLACWNGHDWPENPPRDAGGKRWCVPCRGPLKCPRGKHVVAPDTQAVDDAGQPYCLPCKESPARKRGGSPTVLMPTRCDMAPSADAMDEAVAS